MSAFKIKSYDEATDPERRGLYEALKNEVERPEDFDTNYARPLTSERGRTRNISSELYDAIQTLVKPPVTRITLEFRVPEAGETFLCDSSKNARITVKDIVNPGGRDLAAEVGDEGFFTDRLVVISREEV